MGKLWFGLAHVTCSSHLTPLDLWCLVQKMQKILAAFLLLFQGCCGKGRVGEDGKKGAFREL